MLPKNKTTAEIKWEKRLSIKIQDSGEPTDWNNLISAGNIHIFYEWNGLPYLQLNCFILLLVLLSICEIKTPRKSKGRFILIF